MIGGFSTVEAWEKDYKESREIKCPGCGKVQDNDDCQYPISYNGSEDGPEEWTCDAADSGYECKVVFYVVEAVARTYDVYKTMKEYKDR